MDRELIEKQLAHLVTCLEDIRKHGRPERIQDDPVQRGFLQHTLQTAIQAALDVASIIVSAHRLGEPRTNAELFRLLVANGWLPAHTDQPLRRIAGFRNILVHRYVDVDPAIVRSVIEHHLGDLQEFARSIRDKLGS